MNGDDDKVIPSKIGLGCVTFGREIDQDASFKLMDHAFKNGVTLFDTAAAYGNGLSEQIIGRWMRSRNLPAEHITLATKILPPYTPDQIYRNVETSLERLGLKSIDILYLHRWDKSLGKMDAWVTLDKLVQEGRVEAIGVSNFNFDQLNEAVNLQHANGLSVIAYLQNNNNFAISDVDDAIRNICLKNDIKIITYSPLGAGYLTGKHLNRVQEKSRFELLPAHQDIYFNPVAESRLRKLLQVANETGCSPIHLALSWAFHQPGIYSVLAGGRTPGHLDQAFASRQFYSAEIFSILDS